MVKMARKVNMLSLVMVTSLTKMNKSMKTQNCDLTAGDIFRNIYVLSTLLIVVELKWVLAEKVSAVT